MSTLNQDILSMEDQLEQKAKEFTGKDDFLGLTLMTFVQYISATRSTMFVSHLKQFTTLNEAEHPKVFTNYEKIFGKYSSSLVTADKNYTVYKKIDKFADYPNHLYMLFLYCEEDNSYDVVYKKISEELTEKFSYRYNNENLDKLKVNDNISKGDVLYKSSSYDEDNNYCFGLNAKVGIMLAPCNIEDAYGVRKGFADKMVSTKCDSVMVSINDNDFLLNLYGDENHYKGFPDIGENVKKSVVTAKRRIVNDQILYDMKKANMNKIRYMSDKPYYTKGGTVIDVDIYCNKNIDDIPQYEYNEQLIHYLKNQNRYYKELYNTCKEIVESGAKYSDDIGYIYNRARNILDPDYKWKDSENIFNNMMIEITVIRNINLYIGSKLTGRYGDKGVVSEIIPDEKMPYYIKDGKEIPLDILVNPLSCPNRLNPFQWIESSITAYADQLVTRLKTIEDINERFALLMRFFSYFNDRGEKDQLEEYYNKLNAIKKDEFWDSIYEEGLYIHYPPMWEKQSAIEKLEALRNEFGFTKTQVYIRKWGRVIPLMNKLIIGTRYMLKLKQDSEKGFSARSTGYLSQKGLPEKTTKVKTNEMLYSTTPIAIGRDENNNLGIGISPFILSKFHLFYRTSPFARKKIGKLYTKDILKFKKFKIKRGFTNRNIEILNAKMKSLGIKIDFGFDGLKINIPDNAIHEYTWKGKKYITTREDMRNRLIDELLRKNFNLEKHKGTVEEIEEKYQQYKTRELRKAEGKLVLDLQKSE